MIKKSVVMSTYNGAAYIKEQLESLISQTVLPDEVIIQDDGSTDDTSDIVQRFINDNCLDSWHFSINEKNIGWRDNFINIMNRASGEIIFLCDQDDIWYSNKLQVMTKIMSSNKNIKVLAHAYDEKIEEGGIHERKQIKISSKDRVAQIKFNRKNYDIISPGWSLAVRKDFMNVANESFDIAKWVSHDQAVWSTALMRSEAYFVSTKLGSWRKHGKSAVRSESKKKETDVSKFNKLRKREIVDYTRNIQFLSEMYKILFEMDSEQYRNELDLANKIIFEYTKSFDRFKKKNIISIIFHRHEYISNYDWLINIALCLRIFLN
ncbi:glycosyltransferase [Dellaglioa sp. L3N]